MDWFENLNRTRIRSRQKGVGEKVLVFPVKETSERSERQKPWVSGEHGRVHLVEAARREGIRQIEAKAIERMRSHGLVRKLESY